jgi:hypothetical protein
LAGAGRGRLLQRAGVVHAFLDELLGVGDVLERVDLEAVDLARWIVLLLGGIGARLAEQLERALEAAAPGRTIDRLVVADVLAASIAAAQGAPICGGYVRDHARPHVGHRAGPRRSVPYVQDIVTKRVGYPADFSGRSGGYDPDVPGVM